MGIATGRARYPDASRCHATTQRKGQRASIGKGLMRCGAPIQERSVEHELRHVLGALWWSLVLRIHLDSRLKAQRREHGDVLACLLKKKPHKVCSNVKERNRA